MTTKEPTDTTSPSPIASLPTEESPAATDLSSPAETEVVIEKSDNHGFQSLDPRSVGLEKLQAMIGSAIVATIAAVIGIPVMVFASFPAQLIVPLVWCGVALISLVSTFWWPHWEYDRWSYRINDKVVELRHGVFWHVAVSIPLSRLQHVDLHRGPLERRRGLASLQLHTAGTRDASHTIHGLDVAVATALRDQLIDVANRGVADRGSHVAVHR